MEQKEETVTQLFDQLNSLRTKERCYYDFVRICNKMDNLIRKRHAEIDVERKLTYLHAASGLTHTIGKEIYFIKHHQDLMHKKKAAKVRTDEYYAAVEKAYHQVYQDVSMVLIDEKENPI